MRGPFRGCSTLTLVGLLTLAACGGSLDSHPSTSSTSGAGASGQQTSGGTSGSSTGPTGATGSNGSTGSTGSTGGNSSLVYEINYTMTGLTAGQTLTVTLSYSGVTQTENPVFDPKVYEYYFGGGTPSNFEGLAPGTAYTLTLSSVPSGLNCGVSPASAVATLGSPSAITCTASTASPPSALSNSSASTLAEARPGAAPAPALVRPAVAADAAGLTYVFGGMSPDATGSRTDRSDLWTRSSAGAWSKSIIAYGEPPAPRHAATAWLSADGKLYIFGGAGGGSVLSDFWVFDPANGSWSSVAIAGAAPVGRAGAAGWVGPDGALYLFGSESDPGRASELWAFDIPAGTWRELE